MADLLPPAWQCSGTLTSTDGSRTPLGTASLDAAAATSTPLPASPTCPRNCEHNWGVVVGLFVVGFLECRAQSFFNLEFAPRDTHKLHLKVELCTARDYTPRPRRAIPVLALDCQDGLW